MKAVALFVAAFAVGILVGGIAGGLIIVAAFVVFLMFMVANVRASGEEQLREDAPDGVEA